MSSNWLSYAVMAIGLLGIFAFCAIVIKRYWIDKKPIGGTSQFVGRNILQQFQNADRKESIEHVIYMEEEERKQDFDADDEPPEDGFPRTRE